MASLELWEQVKNYLFSLPLDKSLPKLKIFLRTANVIIQDNNFSILVPNRMIKGLLLNEFYDPIVESVREVSHKNFNVIIEVHSEFSINNRGCNSSSAVKNVNMYVGSVVNKMTRPDMSKGIAPNSYGEHSKYNENSFSQFNNGMSQYNNVMSNSISAQSANNFESSTYNIKNEEIEQPLSSFRQVNAGASYNELNSVNIADVLPQNVISSDVGSIMMPTNSEYPSIQSEPTIEDKMVKSQSLLTLYSPEEFRNTSFYKSIIIQKDKNFDNFVEGPTNFNLCTNGRIVAENPGESSRNPFFVWGDSGLGKTHILNAIANEITKKFPEKKIILVTLEKFYRDFLYAISEYRQNGGIKAAIYNSYKSFYRSADVLLIDDIQQMENYDSIKNEFISLFDEIACSKVQLVFAASTHPSELRKLDNRIRNRISSGVVIKVEPPDKETREKIIEEKIKEMNLRFHRQSIVFLANKFQTNVRVLEGHIKTIGAYVTGTVGNNSRNNFEVTVDIVKEALKDSLNVHAKLVTVDNIKQVVAQYYGISVLDIDSAARPNQIAYPRMMAMALARVLTGTSFPSLGKQFGNKDHSTVMNACNKVKKKINVEHDPKYTEDWENLNLQLTE